MKKLFPGYYFPTENEFSDLWGNCIFVFDANVLLNLYRYSPETREELFGILQDNSDRLWLPHQAALEYQRNRLLVIQQTADAYEGIQKLLEDSLKKFENDLHSLVGKGRHPFVNENYLIEKVSDLFSELREDLVKLSQSHPDLIEDDPIQKTITDLFEGKVGSPYATDQLTSIYREGKERYEKKIPPGYLDNEKDEPKKYGDLILWHQIIDFAKLQKHSIILVTDDRKDDWWKKIKGQTIGPQPELIQEIVIETGILFYMYSADPFMEKAHNYLKRKINQKAVDEVREYREREEMYLNFVQNSLLSEAARATMTGPYYPDAVRAAMANIQASGAAVTGSNAVRAAMANIQAYGAALTESDAVRAAMANIQAYGATLTESDAVRAAMAISPYPKAVKATLINKENSEAASAVQGEIIADGRRTINKDLTPTSETVSDSHNQKEEQTSVNIPTAEIAPKSSTSKRKSKR